MKPIQALAIAAVLAVAAIAGFAAVTKTSTLGASAKHTSTAALEARAHKLDAFEASLQKALKQKPPALPKVPKVHAVNPVTPAAQGMGVAATAAPTYAAAPRVVYRRPAPIIIHKHSSHHGDDGYESEGAGASSHGGGEGGGGHDD